MLIVLLGPPGAGKGTQGERIASALHIPKVATGDVLRAAERAATPLGLEAAGYMHRGELVPDGVILGIMKDTLSGPDAARGAVLDGVVRTVAQAEGLRSILRELHRPLDAVLLFDVDAEELVRRLGGRTVCDTCQTPYTGREPGTVCPKCGGTLMRRRDDEPEAIRNRLRVYELQTAPVIAWYRQNGERIIAIDAAGPVDDITERALAALRGGSGSRSGVS